MASPSVSPPRPWLAGRLQLPGDKSLGHRLILLAALKTGSLVLRGLPASHDLQASLRLVQALGVHVDAQPGRIELHSPGWRGLRAPDSPIDCANSGTTARLGLGLLAGLGLPAVLDGDPSLRARPMERVCLPLRSMGARITGGPGLPLRLEGGALHAIHYTLPVASAQLKSAILLAGLFAQGETRVTELHPSRDHTERLLDLESVSTDAPGRCLCVTRANLDTLCARLPEEIEVPGDPSSACFMVAAALGLPDSLLEIRGLLLNPGRAAALDWLRERGARMMSQIQEERLGEPVGDLIVSYTPRLKNARIGGALVPQLIDEIPALSALAMLRAEELFVEDAAELRVKESDRIAEIARVCQAFGARVEQWPAGFHLVPPPRPRAATLECGPDHRNAMMAQLIALGADGPCELRGRDVAAVSFPAFEFVLGSLLRRHPAPWQTPAP